MGEIIGTLNTKHTLKLTEIQLKLLEYILRDEVINEFMEERMGQDLKIGSVEWQEEVVGNLSLRLLQQDVKFLACNNRYVREDIRTRIHELMEDVSEATTKLEVLKISEDEEVGERV